MYKKQEIERLRSFCVDQWPSHLGVIHGVEHWDRVARFGKMLYVEGADMDVIMAFAYLHDSKRKDDGEDFEHGARASKFIDTIRYSELKFLNEKQIAKLKKACELHTIELNTGDPTIDICFDADRMDLMRVYITPLPDRMATKQGAELVANPDYAAFYADFKNKKTEE